jgi:hypothetical protein
LTWPAAQRRPPALYRRASAPRVIGRRPVLVRAAMPVQSSRAALECRAPTRLGLLNSYFQTPVNCLRAAAGASRGFPGPEGFLAMRGCAAAAPSLLCSRVASCRPTTDLYTLHERGATSIAGNRQLASLATRCSSSDPRGRVQETKRRNQGSKRERPAPENGSSVAGGVVLATIFTQPHGRGRRAAAAPPRRCAAAEGRRIKCGKNRSNGRDVVRMRTQDLGRQLSRRVGTARNRCLASGAGKKKYNAPNLRQPAKKAPVQATGRALRRAMQGINTGPRAAQGRALSRLARRGARQARCPAGPRRMKMPRDDAIVRVLRCVVWWGGARGGLG